MRQKKKKKEKKKKEKKKFHYKIKTHTLFVFKPIVWGHLSNFSLT